MELTNPSTESASTTVMSKEHNQDPIEAKAAAADVEDVKVLQDENMPEILRQFSAEELQAMEKKLVRRIDFRSLPILIILFLLNILDRNAIANARLGGLEESLNINDRQYQTAVMILWGTSFLLPSCTGRNL